MVSVDIHVYLCIYINNAHCSFSLNTKTNAKRHYFEYFAHIENLHDLLK